MWSNCPVRPQAQLATISASEPLGLGDVSQQPTLCGSRLTHPASPLRSRRPHGRDLDRNCWWAYRIVGGQLIKPAVHVSTPPAELAADGTRLWKITIFSFAPECNAAHLKVRDEVSRRHQAAWFSVLHRITSCCEVFYGCGKLADPHFNHFSRLFTLPLGKPSSGILDNTVSNGG